MTPPLLCDIYKISHRNQYPQGTEVVYSTWTSRQSRLKNIDHYVHFGTQMFIKNILLGMWEDLFFNKPKEKIVEAYKRIIKYSLGDPDPQTQHLEDLHDLGYLPLEIKSLPEGTIVPIRVPAFTIRNTDPRFFWLTNYIESLMSCESWQATTSATLALQYRKIFQKYAEETSSNPDFVQFQGHDFSFRGMSSLMSAMYSGMGHLTSFVGTDTIPAILGVEEFYNGNVENELIGTSIPATEHSVQCAYGNDEEYIEKVITEVHPSGFVSVVSDGYDFWNVVTELLSKLKDKIMARDGRVVIRPDSGDPADIICGFTVEDEGVDAWKSSSVYKEDGKFFTTEDVYGYNGETVGWSKSEEKTDAEVRGLIQCLWDTFGGTINEKGYKELDTHIGAIYGDSITLERAEDICARLKAKGFASTNIVFGIGSYTYQYNTRDTLGFALKSTLNIRDGKEIPIFKDPKTDSGVKKSQRGRVAVVEKDGKLTLEENLTLAEEVPGDLLQTVFLDGKLVVDENFSTIKERIKTQAV